MDYFIFNVEDYPILPGKVHYYRGVTYRACDYEKYFKRNPDVWHRAINPELWTEDSVVTFTNYEAKSYIKTNSNPMIRHISNKGKLASLISGEYYQPKTFQFSIIGSKVKINGWNPEIDTLWFVKKVSDLTYGGFDVFPIIYRGNMKQTMKEIQTIVAKSNQVKKYYSPDFIIQEGIRDPLLISYSVTEPTFGLRKYDIRAYGLLVKTGEYGQFEYYFFKKYLIRKSLKLYDPDSIDPAVMLTNTTQAKESGVSSSEMTELGSYERFPREFNAIYQVYVDLCQQRLQPLERTFVLYPNPTVAIIGLDFILDSNYRAYLLEINKSPTIHCDDLPRSRFHHNLEDLMFADDFFDLSFHSIVEKVSRHYSTENWYHVPHLGAENSV